MSRSHPVRLQPSLSRRGFFQGGGAVLAASAWPVGLATTRSVHADSDQTLKVALVGCGARGAGAAAQALSTAGPVKLWAMADLFSDRLESSLAALCKGQDATYDALRRRTTRFAWQRWAVPMCDARQHESMVTGQRDTPYDRSSRLGERFLGFPSLSGRYPLTDLSDSRYHVIWANQ